MTRSILGSVLVLALPLAACTVTASGGVSTGNTPPPGQETATTASPTSTATAPASTGTSTNSGTGTPGTTPDDGDKAGATYILTVTETGGIAVLHIETKVDAGAKKITDGGLRNQKPETRDLTDADVATVTRALDAAKPATFKGAIPGAPPADGMSYEIVLQNGPRRRAVSWNDGLKVPDTLRDLLTTVRKLRESKFKGPNPGAAKE